MMLTLDSMARRGVVFHGFQPKFLGEDDARIAFDSVSPISLSPSLGTTPNAGVPAFLTTYVDPQMIEFLFAPLRAEQIYGAQKKGSWVNPVIAFIVGEATGSTSTYTDFSTDGTADANANYPQRQSYHFETTVRYGAREIDMAGEGRLDLVRMKNNAAALVLNKTMNAIYLRGVQNLQNFGALNDPNLTTPATPVQTGVTWDQSTYTPENMAEDINQLFAKLVQQTAGNIEGSVGREDKLRLVLSGTAAANLRRVNSFGNTGWKHVKSNYPNMEIVEVPEYDTAAGRLVQLVAPELMGQPTGRCAFTEKMRAFPLIPRESSWTQKRMAGSWGTVIFRPVCITQLLGV